MFADRWYPSSKLCSSCGHKLDELRLDVREWTCPKCDVVHDRDINAATNLEYLCTASFAESQACGEKGSGCVPTNTVKPVSVKQELNAEQV